MLSVCDWMYALAAYAYEILDEPLMSDSRYDGLGYVLLTQGTELPGFSAATGQWVHDMDQNELKLVYEYAISVNEFGVNDLDRRALILALDYFFIEYKCCKMQACDAKQK